jgi:thiol-disulfide isomerase/thioredoxin
VIRVAAASGRATSGAVLLGLAAVGLVALAALQMPRPAPGDGMVDLQNTASARLSPVFDEAGKAAPIESFRGKTVILNLWAPWCIPCLKEMPALDRLAARLPEKDFAVIAVTKDSVGASPAKAVFDKMALKRLKLYLDPEGRLAPEVGARGFPTTLILGADGAPLAYREGAADWDSDAMVARLDELAERGRRVKDATGRPTSPPAMRL